METINHECYVSLEVAKLLKEAGFDWKCSSLYKSDGEFKHLLYDTIDWDYGEVDWNNVTREKTSYMGIKGWEGGCSAPTLEVAQRWLREVKNIFIEVTRYETINPLARELFEAVYDKTVDKSFAYIVNVLDANNESIYDEDCFLTYEEAQEEGIQKCLTILLEE